MQHRYRAVTALLLLAGPHLVFAQLTPVPDAGPSSVLTRCRDCGVINSIREVQRQREGSASTVGAGSPIGVVLFIPQGRGDSYVGSVGTREWQQRTTSTSYEYTVRMDGGEFRTVNKDGISDLQVGERVILNGGRIERMGR